MVLKVKIIPARQQAVLASLGLLGLNASATAMMMMMAMAMATAAATAMMTTTKYQFHWWRKAEYPEETTTLLPFDKGYSS